MQLFVLIGVRNISLIIEMITFVGENYIDGFVGVGVLSCGKC